MLRPIEEYTFEEATDELEQLVIKLRENPLAIERNAEMYERAVLLTRHSKRLLVKSYGRLAEAKSS